MGGTFFDREGVSLLVYAACADILEGAKNLLNEINKTFKGDDRKYRIESRIRKEGFLFVGIPGSCTALIGAMTLASSAMVQLLLENGADPYVTTEGGDNALGAACSFGRYENVKFWTKH